MQKYIITTIGCVFLLNACTWFAAEEPPLKKSAPPESKSVVDKPEEESYWGSVKTWCSDSSITLAIKFRLIKDPYIDALDIKVITDNGVVTLTGHVKKAGDIERAATLVRTTDGVSDLVNLLQVVFG